jgi:UDP:flavonoid glycosyltransferase YjiC (YdhE family)
VSKILFASMPFDGHFGPLTGLAMHLKARGHDVLWYTGPSFAPKLAKLGIAHAPFRRAREITADNLAQVIENYDELGVGFKQAAVGVREIFFGPMESHFRDIAELRASFAFDAFICDGALYTARLVAEKHASRVYVVNPAPSPAPTSTTAPPPMFGLTPARTPLGRLRDRIVRALLERTSREGIAILNDLRAREGLAPYRGSLFDLNNDVVRAIFQTGVPGMDFPRDDWPKNFRFVGALLPYRALTSALPASLLDRIARARRVVVVSQGTTDNRDPAKLIEPTLAAMRGRRDVLVVATTAGRFTEELARRYASDNVVVADWLDFGALLEHADVFVCNGGYGSVMLALSNAVPLVLAGKLEGKIDINARLHWRKLGVDLHTERPSPKQLTRAIDRVLADTALYHRVRAVRDELASYDPFAIIEAQLARDGVVAQRDLRASFTASSIAARIDDDDARPLPASASAVP